MLLSVKLQTTHSMVEVLEMKPEYLARGTNSALSQTVDFLTYVSQNIPPFFSLKLLWVLFLCQPKDLGLFIC